jgi:hypothetical protein
MNRDGDTYLARGLGHLVVLLSRLVVRRIFPGPDVDHAIDAARTALGEDAFDNALGAGGALGHHAAGRLALELIAAARADIEIAGRTPRSSA